MNKTDILQLPDTQEVICTAKDLKDLVREVEEEEKMILNTLLDAVSGSDQRFMEEQGIFLDHRFQHIGAIKILEHLLTERTNTNE